MLYRSFPAGPFPSSHRYAIIDLGPPGRERIIPVIQRAFLRNDCFPGPHKPVIKPVILQVRFRLLLGRL